MVDHECCLCGVKTLLKQNLLLFDCLYQLRDIVFRFYYFPSRNQNLNCVQCLSNHFNILFAMKHVKVFFYKCLNKDKQGSVRVQGSTAHLALVVNKTGTHIIILYIQWLLTFFRNFFFCILLLFHNFLINIIFNFSWF